MLESQESLEAAVQTLTFRRLASAQWRMWRKVMRRQPQWFVLRQSGKRHDRWQAVAGPFSRPQDACVTLERLTGGSSRRMRRTSERWQVASLTETMRVYHGNVPLLVEDLVSGDALNVLREHQSRPDPLALA